MINDSNKFVRPEKMIRNDSHDLQSIIEFVMHDTELEGSITCIKYTKVLSLEHAMFQQAVKNLSSKFCTIKMGESRVYVDLDIIT